tara:strand:- start:36 stop:269 length:234 start_codon:yes stop_codon:yes gene_type:complete
LPLVEVEQILVKIHKVVLVDMVVEENLDMELTPLLHQVNMVSKILDLVVEEEHTLQLMVKEEKVVPVSFSSHTQPDK